LSKSNEILTHPETGYKLCKFYENRARDTPLHPYIQHFDQISVKISVLSRDLRSFEIRFNFESNFRFGIRFVVMIRFEIFESSALSIVLWKETIGGG